MRIKSFHAKSMSEAMRQVRDTLGEDAIIVNTREESGGWVKITAAAEQQDNPPPAPAPRLQIKPNAAPVPDLSPEDAQDIVTDTLLKHRVPASTSEKIISAAMGMTETDPQKLLAAALDKVFPFTGVPQASQKPLVLVGPPGAGKTLMTAKMAARDVLNGHRPTIITTDIARAGGVEQLSAFLNILSLPLGQAEDPKTLTAALSRATKGSRIIIDTGGLNPFDPQEMKTLARLLAVCEMEPALVLPAGFDAEEAAEIALTFSVLGVKRLIPTRLDFARRLGGILSAADRACLSFTEGSHTPQVAEGILTLTPDTMAGLLMPAMPTRKQK